MTDTYITVNDTLIVDKSAMGRMDDCQLTDFLAAVSQAPARTIRVVPNIKQFVSKKSLTDALIEGNGNITEVSTLAAYIGASVSDSDAVLIMNFHRLKQRLLEQHDTFTKKNAPTYPFAKIPDAWDIERELVFGKSYISRTNGGSYTIGYKTLQSIWNTARPYWGDASGKCPKNLSIRASGCSRFASIKRDQVEIGCQRIQRYELEQVALRLGWDFSTQ